MFSFFFKLELGFKVVLASLSTEDIVIVSHSLEMTGPCLKQLHILSLVDVIASVEV